MGLRKKQIQASGGWRLINIPFMAMWKEKMIDGVKTCTSRTKRYGSVGDKFEAFGHTFELTKVERVHLENVCAVLYAREGCRNPQEFYDVWVRLHPRKGFVPGQVVWMHHFMRVE